MFGNIKTLERVHGFKRFSPSPLILVIKVGIVCLLFLTATESIELRKQQLSSDRDYVLLIDSSSSMSKTDFNPNRLTAAKTISREWLRALPNSTRVGFIAFTSTVTSSLPLSHDKLTIQDEIEEISIDYAESGTNLDFALNTALDQLERSDLNRTVLLFTDGADDVEKLTIARANSLGVQIDIFGIGSRESENRVIDEEFRDFYQTLELNFTKLEELSNSTDGKAYKISSIDELRSSFQQATLETIHVKLNTTYYIVLLIALLSISELVIYSRFGAL